MNRIYNVDTPKEFRHVGLCAGYAGIDLGLRRAIPTLRTVALSEIEAFACANLVSKMEAGLLDPAPIWSNLKTFPWGAFRDRVDILTGGYPCQPFSQAGSRKGADDPRHLWPFIRDGIATMRPRICFFENVEGHITLGLRDVLFDLAELGYRTTWGIFSAAEIGAPQQRKRVFILAVADRNDEGSQGWHRAIVPECGGEWAAWPGRPREPQRSWEPPRVVGDPEELHRNGGDDHTRGGECTGQVPESGDAGGAGAVGDTEHEGLEGCAGIRRPEIASPGHGAVADPARRNGLRLSPRTSGHTSQHDENAQLGEAESPLGGDAHGPARGMDYAELCRSGDSRVDELRLLGNGVVPATAERAFRSLMGELFVK